MADADEYLTLLRAIESGERGMDREVHAALRWAIAELGRGRLLRVAREHPALTEESPGVFTFDPSAPPRLTP